MSGINFVPTPGLYMFLGFIVGIAIGWAIGFFDSNNRTAKKIEAAESKANLMIKESEKKISQAEQQIAIASQASQNPHNDAGLLRLKNENGRFVLELDGESVTRALSPDKKKRLIELITVFRPWLDSAQPAPAQPQQAVAAVQEPISGPLQTVSSSPKKPEPEKKISSLSIVQQIDTVLQARIVDTPLAKQGVRLQESPQGGVEVYVGIQKFLTVDDVPDTFIKSEIRAAIAEWEEKYTPRS